MQISAIHELPADRIPIKTCVIKEDLRQKAYEMIGQGELAGGHQAYIICPLVEASEQTEAENVTDYVERIRPIFWRTGFHRSLTRKNAAQGEKMRSCRHSPRKDADPCIYDRC